MVELDILISVLLDSESGYGCVNRVTGSRRKDRPRER